MQSNPHLGGTAESGPALVVIFVATRPGVADTAKTSTTTSDDHRPVWPANDASFDYRMPRTSGAAS
jgi:hypothetical protein